MAEQPNNLSPYVILFIFFISSSTVISHKPAACIKRDQDSLQSSFDMPSHLNWSSEDCCHWEGITCDMAGRITHISLPYKGLKLKGGDSFPSSPLGNLSHLTHLNLSHNSLEGSLDQTGFFSSLSRLEILDLSYNLLSGELPFSLPSSNIQMLDLSYNLLQGSIPSSFFKEAWRLTSFNVSYNFLTGSIPSSYICLHSYPLISLLDFSSNNFNGSISCGLGKCLKLQVFRAGSNSLSGLLPEDIYNATKLEEISLPQNSFHGAISERIVNLANLEILDLNSNGLSGKLPSSIGKLSKLKLLLLHSNNLEGSVPPPLMNCMNLTELNLGFNKFDGNISALNFSKLSQLTKLDFVINRFTGILPVSLYSCKSLKAIRLSQNDLQVEIQSEILSLKSLSFLSLGQCRLANITSTMKILMRCKSLVFLSVSNNFVGEEMPADLGMVDFEGFQKLRYLSLSGCEFTGQLPAWLSNLKKLQVLDLGDNRITGSIPNWLGTLPRLSYLSLGNNSISGEFPKELCTLPMLISETNAAQVDDLELIVYKWQGASYHQYRMSNLRGKSIGNSTVETRIDFGQVRIFSRKLDLGNNNLSGNIPDQISNLRNLEVLELQMNHFSGKVPPSLASLNFLNYINVSYNNLEGPIPRSTHLQRLDASSFEGNAKLCGAPLPNKCLPIKGNDADNGNSQDHEENGHENQIPWFHISVVLGFITGFWGVCGSLVLKEKWRYGYFKFVDRVQERILLCRAKLQSRLRS
ncbi:putative leucine-rich repeat-containing, plant-type, leucine-rich repeat domain, L [Rosa chinensis]|uniref:Putative leucine-rich repeat-containing, plant-type, leucine-rich repeat domain, L n=1 Tax=Rosa chinensis TaxID=74649 RepID=A0A2P6QHV1_ROSCH|nr:receptor-like protein 2 [Rosa chinensis]PRQ33744.1 putative leucine-rich repeat-containing, plant-type, leucine-rich repeat domain, L [Rosa chinensis]